MNKELYNFLHGNNFHGFGANAFKILTPKESGIKETIFDRTTEYSTCFDLAGFSIKSRPVIIFEIENDVIFLKFNSLKLNKEGNIPLGTSEMVKHAQALIFQKTSSEFGVPLSDLSVLDTCDLYIMNKDDFFECYDIYSDVNQKTIQFSDYYKDIILTQVYDNLRENHFSLTRVHRKQNNGVKYNEPELLYTPNEFLDMEYKYLKNFKFKDKTDKKSQELYQQALNYKESYSKKNIQFKDLILDINKIKLGIENYFKTRDTTTIFEYWDFFQESEYSDYVRLYLYQERVKAPEYLLDVYNLYVPLNMTKTDVYELYKSHPELFNHKILAKLKQEMIEYDSKLHHQFKTKNINLQEYELENYEEDNTIKMS